MSHFFAATPWEERISSLSPAEIFSHQRSFSTAGAPWLYWLREAPCPAFTTTVPTESLTWYADQLSVLVESFEDSLTTGPVNTTPPPALLLLLRLLRSALTDGGRGSSTDATELAVIELYSQDGLLTLSTLVDCIADHLILLAQQGATCCGPRTSMLAELMGEGVEIIAHLVAALVYSGGEEFRDRTPVKAVCRAYAVATSASILGSSLQKKVNPVNIKRC